MRGGRAIPIIVLCLAAAALAASWLLLRTGHDYRVHAEFRNVDGLRKNSEVQIGGVRVGKVARLELNRDDTVRAELTIDDSAAPIGRDARVHVRSKNLLGAKLVDIDPGHPTRPAPSGTTIPLSRTDRSVDLDEVLSTLDSETRLLLRVLIHETGVALEGRGAELNRLLDQMPSSLSSTRRLVGEFSSDNEALGRMVEESDRVVASIARERRSLGHLVDNAEGFLAVTARRRAELGATVARAPATLAQLRSTLDRVEEASAPLGAAAAAIGASAPPLTSVLRELPRLEPAAVPTLRTAHAVSPRLNQIADGTTPLVRRLRPVADRLAELAAASDPVSEYVDRGIGDLLAVLEGWARSIQNRDGASHVFRGTLIIGEELMGSLVQRFVNPAGTTSTSRSRRPAARRGRPAQAPAPPAPVRPAARQPAPSASPARAPQETLRDQLADPSAGATETLLDFLLGR